MLSIWPGYFVWDSLQHQSNVLHVEVQSSSLKLELYDNVILSKHSKQTNKPWGKDAPGLPAHSRSQNQAPVKRKQNFQYNNYKVYVGNPLNWTWSGENYETMSKS